LHDITILIVDDDASIRAVLTQTLQEENYTIVQAANGREALEYLHATAISPDLMLLDLVMPKMTGYDVLESLRNQGGSSLPVLIMSGQQPDTAILSALNADLRDFVAKPFELEELLIRIQALLQRAPRPEAVSASHMRVYALGSLRIYRDEALLFDESWRNRPAKTIFKRLFSNPGQRFARDMLADELWPETEPEIATNRLRVAIHELRKMLRGTRKQADAPQYIGQQEGTYFFDPSGSTWSDVQAFDEYMRQGRSLANEGRSDAALKAFQKAEALYQGDYLRDDPYSEWTVPIRERLREARLSALAQAAQLHAGRGEPEDAAALCRRILRSESWREEVYRRMMEYLAAAGRSHEALRAFEECRRALRAEMDTNPSHQTIQVRDRIARELNSWHAVGEG